MQRVEAFETALFKASMDATQTRHGKAVTPTPDDDLGCALAFMDPAQERAFAQMNRYRRTAHLDYHRALEALRRLQRDREEAPARQLRAFKAQQEYLAMTTAAPKIPAAELITPTPSTPMASIRKEPSLHLIRPENLPQTEAPPIPHTQNLERAIE